MYLQQVLNMNVITSFPILSPDTVTLSNLCSNGLHGCSSPPVYSSQANIVSRFVQHEHEPQCPRLTTEVEVRCGEAERL